MTTTRSDIHFATGIGTVLCGSPRETQITFASPELVTCPECARLLVVRWLKADEARRAAQWDADEAAGLHTPEHGYCTCG